MLNPLSVIKMARNRRKLTGYKRAPNFKAEDKAAVLSIAAKYADIIMSKQSSHSNLQKKRVAWEMITEEFNQQCPNTKRHSIQLKHLYENLRQKAKRQQQYGQCSTTVAFDDDDKENIRVNAVGYSNHDAKDNDLVAEDNGSDTKDNGLGAKNNDLDAGDSCSDCSDEQPLVIIPKDPVEDLRTDAECTTVNTSAATHPLADIDNDSPQSPIPAVKVEVEALESDSECHVQEPTEEGKTQNNGDSQDVYKKPICRRPRKNQSSTLKMAVLKKQYIHKKMLNVVYQNRKLLQECRQRKEEHSLRMQILRSQLNIIQQKCAVDVDRRN